MRATSAFLVGLQAFERGFRQHLVEGLLDRRQPGRVVGDILRQIAACRDVAQEPDGLLAHQILNRKIKFHLDFARDLVVERIDFAVEVDEAETVARQHIGGCDRRLVGPGLVDDPVDEGTPRRG